MGQIAKRMVLAVITVVIFLLTGCTQDAMKEVKKDDYEFTIVRSEEKYYVAESVGKSVYLDWDEKGEYPPIEDGQYAVVKADVTIRTGGEAGYYEDVFIRKLKTYEILPEEKEDTPESAESDEGVSEEMKETSESIESAELIPVAELVNKQSADPEKEKSLPEMLPKMDYNAPDSIVMVPTEANLVGMHSGYMFLPIDGAVYRYEPNDTSEDPFTMGNLIYECTEVDVLGTTTYWEVYELEEYPNHEKIKCVPKGQGDSCIFKYAPALRTDKEVFEEAEKRGFVIIRGFRDEIINKDNWFAFLDKVAAGEPASVCIGNLYSNVEMNMSADIREATNEDYSSFFMTELVYDGVEFTVSPVNWVDGTFVQCEIPGYNSPEQTYPYLMHYVDKGRTGIESFASYDKYVLTDRNDVTWNDLEMDMILCTFSMRYYEVYAEYVMK